MTKIKGWMEHLAPLDTLPCRSLFHAGDEKPSRAYGMDYTKVIVVAGDERVFTESDMRAMLYGIRDCVSIGEFDINDIAAKYGVSLDPA